MFVESLSKEALDVEEGLLEIFEFVDGTLEQVKTTRVHG